MKCVCLCVPAQRRAIPLRLSSFCLHAASTHTHTHTRNRTQTHTGEHTQTPIRWRQIGLCLMHIAFSLTRCHHPHTVSARVFPTVSREEQRWLRAWADGCKCVHRRSQLTSLIIALVCSSLMFSLMPITLARSSFHLIQWDPK